MGTVSRMETRRFKINVKIRFDHYFCNEFSLDDTRNCHDLYHKNKKYHGKDIDT